MIEFRPFRNGDIPLLATLWNSQPTARWLAQPVTPMMLDEGPLAKLLFDRQGMIVALDDGRLTGFVHAGFGPAADRRNVDREKGAIYALLVESGDTADRVAMDLIARAERYLVEQGARSIRAGGGPWTNPFYMGFWGGSNVPGLLASQAGLIRRFSAAGYTAGGESRVMHLTLGQFRPPMSRKLLQLRRSVRLELAVDEPLADWWQASALSQPETVRFTVLQNGGEITASALCWSMELLAHTWGVRAVGLADLWSDPARRRQGLAMFLLAEALRQFQASGISLIEAVVAGDNSPAQALFSGLGFQEVDRVQEFQKRVDAA